jgi:hypothetical protein
MDASRSRRTRDPARKNWYARYRQWRFARHYGFLGGADKVITPGRDGRTAAVPVDS